MQIILKIFVASFYCAITITVPCDNSRYPQHTIYVEVVYFIGYYKACSPYMYTINRFQKK